MCILILQLVVRKRFTILFQLNVYWYALTIEVAIINPVLRYRYRSRVQLILKSCRIVRPRILRVRTCYNGRSLFFVIVVIGNYILKYTIFQSYLLLIDTRIYRKVMPGSSSRIDRSISVYIQRFYSCIGRITGRHVRRVGFRVILILNTGWTLDRIPVASVRAVLKRYRDIVRTFVVEVVKVIPRLIQCQIKYGDVMLIGDCGCIGFSSGCIFICLELYRCCPIYRLWQFIRFIILLLVILILFVILIDECFCNLVIQLFPIAIILVNDKAVPVLVWRRVNIFLRRRRHLIICQGMVIHILIARYTGNLQIGWSIRLTVSAVLELLGYIDSGTFDVRNRFFRYSILISG